MKQFPNVNNLKFKKYHKINYFYNFSLEKKIFCPMNGEYCLQSLEPGKITFKQIEACRRTLKRGLKKVGVLLIKLFTDIPVTKKALSSRMGKGKGAVSHWIDVIKKGQVLFEISGVSKEKAFFILKKSKSKLPIKTKIGTLFY